MSLANYVIDPSNYEEEKKIGEGNFSSVYLVHPKGKVNIKIALKKIPIDLEDHDLQKHFIREISIMSGLDHPSLVKLVGFSFPSKKDQICKIYSDYMPNNTLKEILKKDQYLNESKKTLNSTHKSIIVYGVASAMKYLHKNNIIHRDLKPENVFLDHEFHPVLSDFGLSRFINNDFNITGKLGTPYYMAPELFDNSENNLTYKVDVYAFAVTLLSLFTSNYKFSGQQPTSIRNLVAFIKSGKRYIVPENVPDFYVNLIDQCWSNDVNQRPSFEDIVQRFEEEDSFIFDGADRAKVHDYIESLKKFDDSRKMNQSMNSSYSDDDNNNRDDEYDEEETKEFDFS